MSAFAKQEPNIAPGVFVADSADVVGAVEIGAGSSVWFQAVIRADSEGVRIGRRVNIQDGVVIHEDPGYPVRIGDDVTVGHRAILHGCTIGNDVLIGMGAVLLNGCVIGDHCVVGAGALVTGGTVVPEGSLVLGAPAKTIKPLKDNMRDMAAHSAREYADLGLAYRAGEFRRYSPGSEE